MIQLYTFGPAFGLPDPSPFVVKAEVLLKMSGIPYERRRGNPMKAPKGKLPSIIDKGTAIADSSFIRLHLENQHGVAFDKGVAAERLASLWLAEKYCEDNVYFLMIKSRWLDDENYRRGPRQFFDSIPFPVRTFVTWKIRSNMKKMLWLQGMGRHSDDELVTLLTRGVESLVALLGERPFFGGEEPCGADATLFAFILGMTCDRFTSPFNDVFMAAEPLKHYSERMLAKFYPDGVE